MFLILCYFYIQPRTSYVLLYHLFEKDLIYSYLVIMISIFSFYDFYTQEVASMTRSTNPYTYVMITCTICKSNNCKTIQIINIYKIKEKLKKEKEKEKTKVVKWMNKLMTIVVKWEYTFYPHPMIQYMSIHRSIGTCFCAMVKSIMAHTSKIKPILLFVCCSYLQLGLSYQNTTFDLMIYTMSYCIWE